MPVLKLKKAVLNVVDVQGKLATLMYRKDELYANLRRIIRGAQALGVPIIWNEQLPDKLGETASEIKEVLTGSQPLIKPCFSCYGNDAFVDALEKTGRSQVLLVGIETHICVYQTCHDLLRNGYKVHVMADAVSSRFELNYRVGLDRMHEEGATISCVEMALFEMMGTTKHDAFRNIVGILKE